MSPTHFTFGAGTMKSRFTRSGTDTRTLALVLAGKIRFLAVSSGFGPAWRLDGGKFVTVRDGRVEEVESVWTSWGCSRRRWG